MSLTHLFILLFPQERSYEMNVASIRSTRPYLALHNFTLFGEKYKLYRCSLYNILCPLSGLPNMPKLLPS
jgi:hypothetical protein